MLRKTLLVTSALVFATSVAYAGHKTFNLSDSKAMQKLLSVGHPGQMTKGVPAGVITTARGTVPHHNVLIPGGGIYNNLSKDANAEFISWYGFRAENASSCWNYSIYHSCFNEKADNALQFYSKKTQTTTSATVGMFSYYPSAQYAVNIYSSASGLPGAVIGTSTTFSDSDTGLCCTSARTVSISANLTKKTNYFVGLVGSSVGSNGGWNMEDTDLTGATVDYFHYKEHITYTYGSGLHSTNYSSPWHASTYYPEAGAVKIQ